MERKMVWIPYKEKGFISLAIEQPHQFGLWGGSYWLHQIVMDSIMVGTQRERTDGETGSQSEGHGPILFFYNKPFLGLTEAS